MQYSSDVAFTPTVKRIQAERGSRNSYARMERANGGFATAIDADIAAFIATRESVYLATANAEGQPYIQHRGGPAGFIRVLDERTLAFADFAGNKQYISTGNLEENPHAFIFMMDYETQQRVKFWGTARVVRDDPALLAQLATPGYAARTEQAIVFTVDAWDANCPQHIPHLVKVAEVAPIVQTLRSRVATLEAALRAANVPLPD